MRIKNYSINFEFDLKIALVADLHEKNPVEVIDTLRQLSPDFIFVAGDLWERQDSSYNSEWNHWNMSRIQTRNRFEQGCYFFTQLISGKMSGKQVDNRTEEEKDYSNFFLREVSQIAPVYLSTGNHEWYYTEDDYDLIQRTGTTLLDNAHICLEWNGQKVLIGGLSTRADGKWLNDFFDAQADKKILLCHHPEYVDRFLVGKGKVDLILSGHAHGGQWRIFGKIPVYAPGQGLFPKYTHGIYETPAGTLLVTSGCCNTISIPRYGNPCEVVELEL